MSETIVLVRLMVEVASEAEAEEEVGRIVPQVERCGSVAASSVEKYWKIPEYCEITLHVHPAGPALDAYRCLLQLAPTGWTMGRSEDDPWAVWNSSRGWRLLTERVRWAEFSLWRRGDDPSPEARSEP